MDLWIRTEAAVAAAKRQRKIRLRELESELDALDWQDVHKRACALGVDICKDGTSERRPLAEIKVDIKATECPRMVTMNADLSYGFGIGNGNRKRPREGVDAEISGLVSPELLETHEVCCRFHNYLAIVGASPGHLHLGNVQAPSAEA